MGTLVNQLNSRMNFFIWTNVGNKQKGQSTSYTVDEKPIEMNQETFQKWLIDLLKLLWQVSNHYNNNNNNSKSEDSLKIMHLILDLLLLLGKKFPNEFQNIKSSIYPLFFSKRRKRTNNNNNNNDIEFVHGPMIFMNDEEIQLKACY